MSDLNVALIIEAIDKATAPLRRVTGGFRRLGSIPAHAGKPSSPATARHTPGVYPRACEETPVRGACLQQAGSRPGLIEAAKG